MMKWIRLIVAWIGGIIATAVLFFVLTVGSIELLALYFTLTDPHAGAGMGWLELILAPIALPIIGALSVGGGIIAGVFLNSKMRSQIQLADQKGPASGMERG
jgi:hypothetical protein